MTMPLTACSILDAMPRKFGPSLFNSPVTFQTSLRNLLNALVAVNSAKYFFKAPTFGSIDMSLSFKITSKLVSETPAWFKPSNAIPPVIAPSPITAMCWRSSFLYLLATAIPTKAEIDVEECPTPKVSYSLSLRFGNPLKPLYFRFEGKSCLLPVNIL